MRWLRIGLTIGVALLGAGVLGWWSAKVPQVRQWCEAIVGSQTFFQAEDAVGNAFRYVAPLLVMALLVARVRFGWTAAFVRGLGRELGELTRTYGRAWTLVVLLGLAPVPFYVILGAREAFFTARTYWPTRGQPDLIVAKPYDRQIIGVLLAHTPPDARVLILVDPRRDHPVWKISYYVYPRKLFLPPDDATRAQDVNAAWLAENRIGWVLERSGPGVPGLIHLQENDP
jgi:hypothetical protein